jgi:hypothetical protein
VPADFPEGANELKTTKTRGREELMACFQNRVAVLAPEARKTVAHGETVGLAVKTNQAPAGAAENRFKTVLSPHSGAWTVCGWKPTVSPWATINRCSAASNGF